MDEQKKNNEIEEAASALIENSETVSDVSGDKDVGENIAAEKAPEKEGKFFKKYKIKDIVFLAIMTACTLTTGVVMPFVQHIQLFGIVQLCLGLQFSIFPVIGMMKVRKPGALTILGIFSGAPLVFFSTVMFFNNFVSAVIAEALMLLIFRGYKKKSAVFFTAGIYMPLSLPVSVLFSMWLNGQSYSQLIDRPVVSIFTSLGTIVLGFVGSAIGMKIASELQKAGKLKPYGESENV